MIEAVLSRTNDPDQPLASWAKEGAPMGIAQEIQPGNVFPTQQPGNTLTEDELAAGIHERKQGNHPSFQDYHNEAELPGIKLIEEHLNNGFGLLFKDQASAEHGLARNVSPHLSGTSPK